MLQIRGRRSEVGKSKVLNKNILNSFHFLQPIGNRNFQENMQKKPGAGLVVCLLIEALSEHEAISLEVPGIEM